MQDSSNNILNIELYRYGSIVFGEILGYKKELKKRLSQIAYKTDIGEFLFYINDYTELQSNALIIKNLYDDEDNECVKINVDGDDLDHDNDFTFHYDFESIKEAVEVTRKIKNLIDEINGEERPYDNNIERIV